MSAMKQSGKKQKVHSFHCPFLIPEIGITMANLDIKLKLSNTAATLLLIGFHCFSYSGWFVVLIPVLGSAFLH